VYVTFVLYSVDDDDTTLVTVALITLGVNPQSTAVMQFIVELFITLAFYLGKRLAHSSECVTYTRICQS
jgi:hypothetical protein